MKHENPSTQLEPSMNLGILIGLLLTDGWVSKNKTSWQIGFTNKSEELHSLFKGKMNAMFGFPHFTTSLNSRSKEIKVTTVNSKEIGKQLHSILPSFRKKAFEDGTFSECKIPEFFFNLQENEIRQVLSAIFSADGGVTLSVTRRKRNIKWGKYEGWEIKAEVILGCKNPLIKKQFIQLLKNLGFSPRKDDGKIILEKKKDIVKFRNEIGFVQGLEISKSRNWKGFEKNRILNLAIKTLNFRKKDLQQFKTKEEIITFLKSFLMAPVIKSAS